MGLFNFNRAKKQANTSSAESGSKWDILSSQTDRTEVISPAEAAEAERVANDKARQERKAIGMILYGEQAIMQPDLNIGQQDRERAYDLINAGSFGPAEQSALLQRIAPPSRTPKGSPEAVFTRLNDKHSRRIFAFTNGISDVPENLSSLSSDIVNSTLSQYPTPVEFSIKADEMMGRLRATNSEAKCEEYARDLEKFKKLLYGKRQEYYEAFQALERQAAQRRGTQDSRERVLQALHQSDSDQGSSRTPGSQPQSDRFSYPEEDLGYLAPEAQERWRMPPETEAAFSAPPKPESVPVRPVEVYRIDAREAERYLREGRIDGDPFVQDGQAYQLTPDYLKSVGLGPEYTFKLDGQTDVGLSKIYQIQGRDAVTAYVRTDNGTRIVSYYRSNSQGGWRYLPDYVSPSDAHGSIKWFGKGYDEESLNLPGTTQEALEIINAQPHLQNDQLHPAFAFAGTAKRYESKDQYREAKNNRALRGDFYQEISLTPLFSLGKMTQNKQAPEELNLTDPSTAPNFDQPSMSRNFQSSFYGPVASEYYKSNNGRLTWIFNCDQLGRAWIGGIEVPSPINSAGLHTQWAQAGDFGTPLYEYEAVSGGYGDKSDTRGHDYVSMWKNYLSRQPLIQKYLAHKTSKK